MANRFYREAVDGGDQGVWGAYEQNQNRLALGLISCRLYNDGGALKLGKGRIGFDNSSVKGAFYIDTITTIDISGLSVSNWAKIEITNSGSGVNLTAVDISGANDETTLPSEFTNAYDGEKGGFYITATKRCIGLAWKNAAGALEGIINVLSSHDGYIGYSVSDDANDYRYQFYKIKGYEPYKFISEKKEITADATITAGAKKQELICKTNDLRINLPALSTIDEFKLRIFNASGAMLHINPNGSETICGIADIFSKSENDLIDIERIDGKWRITNDWKPYFYSGWLNCSDYTDRHFGLASITYNNLSGTFKLGEKISGANGSYGWSIYDNASNTVILVWVVTVGANIFNNAEQITGQISSATATVNMGSGLKNVDSNVYHGWGRNLRQIQSKLFMSTDGTEANSFEVPYVTESSGNFGLQPLAVDTSNFKIQTGAGGFYQMSDNATRNQLDIENYYINIFQKLLAW